MANSAERSPSYSPDPNNNQLPVHHPLPEHRHVIPPPPRPSSPSTPPARRTGAFTPYRRPGPALVISPSSAPAAGGRPSDTPPRPAPSTAPPAFHRPGPAGPSSSARTLEFSQGSGSGKLSGEKRAREEEGAEAPQGVWSCSLCPKTFRSDRALGGHMAAHPERAWRGVRPPPVFNAAEEFADLLRGAFLDQGVPAAAAQGGGVVAAEQRGAPSGSVGGSGGGGERVEAAAEEEEEEGKYKVPDLNKKYRPSD